MSQQQSAFSAVSIYTTKFLNADGTISWPWVQQFQQAAAQLKAPVSSQVPATSAADGVAGQISFDANWLYVCIGGKPTVWKRVALSAF